MASAHDRNQIALSQYPPSKSEATTGADSPTRQPLTPSATQDLGACFLSNSSQARREPVVLTQPTRHGNLKEPTVAPTTDPHSADLRSYSVFDNKSDTQLAKMESESASATCASGSTGSPSAHSASPSIADAPLEFQFQVGSEKYGESAPVPSHETGSDSQPIGSPLVQKSYELRYSPPSSRTVSCTSVSPVMTSFDRQLSPQSGSFGHTDGEDTYLLDAESGVSESGEDHSGVTISRCSSAENSDSESNQDETSDCGGSRVHEWTAGGSTMDPKTGDNIPSKRDFTNLSSNGTADEKDDAGDVMNPSDGYGGGIVIPDIHGVSFDGDELEKIVEGIPEGFDGFSQADGIVDSHLPKYSAMRRASSPTGQPEPSFASRGHVQKSGDGRIQFDSGACVQDTPFSKTLKYFKQFKDKENSPSKSRRNASLPEEIAELAKAAQQDGIEDEQEMWKAYRDIDLAPEDPVMDAGLAGDLIMTGTPTKRHAHTIRKDCGPDSSFHSSKISGATVDDAGTIYEISIPGHYDDAFRLRFRSASSVQTITSFVRQRGEELEANEEDIDRVIESFLTCPLNFVVDDSELGSSLSNCVISEGEHESGVDTLALGDANEGMPITPVRTQSTGSNHGGNKDEYDKQLILYQDDPVFVRVIGMLPRAMFWAIAQPITHYSSKAFDALMYKLVDLTLDDTDATT